MKKFYLLLILTLIIVPYNVLAMSSSFVIGTDIVDSTIEEAQGFVEFLKDHDVQKMAIIGGIVLVAFIILLVLLIKLKNHKLNKKFKEL